MDAALYTFKRAILNRRPLFNLLTNNRSAVVVLNLVTAG